MPESKERLTARALLEIKRPESLHLSPDGKRLVFHIADPDFQHSKNTSHLWLCDTQTGKTRQLTYSFEGESDARWSEDGVNLAFLSTRPDPADDDDDAPDDFKSQLWLLPADGGEAHRITQCKGGVEFYQWSPDSSAIFFLTVEARPKPLQLVYDEAEKQHNHAIVEHAEKLRKQIWRYDLEQRESELAFTGDFGMEEFAVSPDGSRIAYTTNQTGEPNDFHLYDIRLLELESGRDRPLVSRAGAKNSPQWSPDGSQLAYLSPRDPQFSFSQECVWRVPAEGGDPENLFAQVDFDALALGWSRRDGHLYCLVADRVSNRLLRIDDQELTVLFPSDTHGNVIDWDNDSAGNLYLVCDSDIEAFEVWKRTSGGETVRLTELNKDFMERFQLPQQTLLNWKSDEFEIDGILITPSSAPTTARLPLVVQVHGGPRANDVFRIRNYHFHALWAAEDYAVLLVNYRGSSGYGNTFSVANRRDLGGGDFRDILSGIEHVVELGFADPARVGIMGGSYGGYMTNWAISQSNRFAAAISQFGMFNLVTDFSNSSLSRFELEYLGAPYWEDPDIYSRCSPSSFLAQINTPTLILHGESDDNTFISNSREMYQALRQRGVPTEFVRYPGESHGLQEPNHRLDEMRRCLAWFDRYLKGAGERSFYRMGEMVHSGVLTLCVLRAEELEPVGWDPERGRLIEVVVSVASTEPLDDPLILTMERFVLASTEGDIYDLAGIPVDFGAGKSLLEGTQFQMMLAPDELTGRAGTTLHLGFLVPNEAASLSLTFGDFAPVHIYSPGKPPQEEDQLSPNSVLEQT